MEWTSILKLLRLGLNFRIPSHLLASHWIRIATIVIFLVLQTTPTHVNGEDGYSELAPSLVWKTGQYLTITPVLEEQSVNSPGIINSNIPQFNWEIFNKVVLNPIEHAQKYLMDYNYSYLEQ